MLHIRFRFWFLGFFEESQNPRRKKKKKKTSLTGRQGLSQRTCARFQGLPKTKRRELCPRCASNLLSFSVTPKSGVRYDLKLALRGQFFGDVCVLSYRHVKKIG